MTIDQGQVTGADVLRSQALGYGGRGWRVVPLHWITAEGRCSCRHQDCKPGKHPIINGWTALASTAGADIWEWWQQWPAANVGVATGRESGIWTLDIDPDNGGDVTLAAAVAEYGPLPPTRTHRTGSGGTHYLWSYPEDFDVPPTSGTVLGRGIDTLGEGSQLVAPPSVSGKGPYVVADDREPAPGPAPGWLLSALRAHVAQKAAQAIPVGAEPVDPAAIPARLRQLLTQTGPGSHSADFDRSEHFWKIVSEAHCVFTQGQAVTLVTPWCKVSGKYLGRIERQVAACWAKLDDRARALRLPASTTDSAPVPQPSGDARNVGEEAAPVSTPGRATVEAGSRNPVDIARDVEIPVLAANSPPSVFAMGTSAVILDGSTLRPLDSEGWLLHVCNLVDFAVRHKDGDGTRLVQPPAGAMKLVPLVLMPKLPPLDGIKTTPFIDAAGSVVAADGYHAPTRLLLQTAGLSLPAVPESPGAEDVAAAVKLLTEDWLGDFPFAGDADRANALAVLLTLTGRAFFSLAPLFVVDASTPGSGKGLLVATISLIAAGEAPHLMELPSDGEEQRKKITSALLAGQELVTWDESHVIQGRSLAMILTAENYSDRLLGGNKMISVVNRFTQVALGNNVQVWGDMKRRVVPCRLVPDTDRPEKRTGFRHPDLESWVRGHRGELLQAVLTIWRNWIAQGRPKADVAMGSFDRWARTVGGALQAAGVEGFLAGTSQWLQTSDDDSSEWQEHLITLRRTFGSGTFTAHDVAEKVTRERMALPWFKRDPDVPLARAIGYRYRALRDRWLGPVRLVSPGMSNGRARWRVEFRDAGNIATDATISTQNPDEPDTAGRDGGIGRHPSGDLQPQFQQPYRVADPDPLAWPDDSAGAEANR